MNDIRGMRKIPATMATQHPDNAQAPYWERDGDGFVSIYEELDECLSAFKDLGVDEFMWDFEGKYADEAVIDKLFASYFDYFKKNQLGRDKFLTFRLPNIWHEKGYSLPRALMVILTSQDFAHDLRFHQPPLFEVILPMVEKAEMMTYIQECFRKLARLKSREFNHRADNNSEELEIIPLVEGIKYQLGIDKILEKYIQLHQKLFKRKPIYLRPFLARSDPALSSGLAANVLANKIALAEIYGLADKSGVEMHPIIGVGSLVFRGGLRPGAVADFVGEYGGVRTVTVQSAFRYDYPLSQVKQAIKHLNRQLPLSAVQQIAVRDMGRLKKIVSTFEKNYQGVVGRVAREMEPFFRAVPKRRERRLHIGFLSYGRKIGNRDLPRAISFCSALYSIGVPPELIGLGRTLKGLNSAELGLVQKYYINLASDLERAGRYLNEDNLASLVKTNLAWEYIQKDIKLIREILGVSLGPQSQDDWLHKNLTSNTILLRHKKNKLEELIIETGKIRQSLG